MAYAHDADSSDSSDEEIAAGPSWMNRFSSQGGANNPAATPRKTHPPIATITAGPNASAPQAKGGEPEWMNKFGGVNRNNNFNDSSTSLSSSTHSFRTEETPAWMNKFKKSANAQQPQPMNGSHHNQMAPPSPGRSAPPPPTTTPSTPSWMKQYRKTGGNVAGAPSIPAVPSLNSSNHSATTTPAWKKSTLNNFNSSSSMQSNASSSAQQGAAAAPATPSWMNRFDKKQRPQVNDIPPAPAPDHENGQVASTKPQSSTLSHSNNGDPDWMKKFNKKQPVPASPVPAKSKSSSAEPEWMSKFKQIGMSEENAAVKERATITKTGAPPRPPMHHSAHHEPSGHSPSAPMLSQSSHNVGVTPQGVPASTTPKASRKKSLSAGSMARGIGVVSAPSSPVGAVGKPKTQLPFHLSPAPTGGAQRRQFLGVVDPPTLSRVDPPTKVEDPAAKEPEKLDWMDKVKAVASDSEEKPEWMQSLLAKKHGHALPEEKERSNKTPPWKIRERLKEEQAEKLRESLGLGLGEEEGAEDDDESQGSWASEGDSAAEAEALPEWMKQFKKMDLKAARVVTAQGRAPQTVALLRTGSARMVTRTGDIVDDSQVIKAISVRSHSTRSLMASRHASFRNSKASNDTSKHSKTPDDDTSQGSFGNEQGDQPSELPSRGNMTRDLLQPAGGPPQRKPSELLEGTSKSDTSTVDKSEESSVDYQSVHSSDTLTLSSQVEIDNSAPNAKGMWGETVKAKKPGNATLMSWRMIQNQKEKVRERIERAKRGEAPEETEGEEAGGTLDSFDESATALFFSGDKKGDKKSESFSMENSAAALFGFGGGQQMSKNSESISMENSAANLFGFAGGAKDKHSGSISMENSAAALFGAVGSAPKRDSAEGNQSLSNFLSNSKSDLEKPTVPPTSQTKSTDASSSGSNSEAEKTAKTRPLTSNQPTSFATTAAVAEPPVGKANPPAKKKSWLDDSDSDSDSDSEDEPEVKSANKAPSKSPQPVNPKKETATPPTASTSATTTEEAVSPPKRKKSFLDDSDSDDDSSSDGSSKGPSAAKSKPYKPTKTESTTPLVPKKDEGDKTAEKALFNDDFGFGVVSSKEPDTQAPSDSLETAEPFTPGADPFTSAANGFDTAKPFDVSDTPGNEDTFDKSFANTSAVNAFSSHSKSSKKSLNSSKDKEVENVGIFQAKEKDEPVASPFEDSKAPKATSDDFSTGFGGLDIEDDKAKAERNEWEAALMGLKTEAMKPPSPKTNKEKVPKKDEKKKEEGKAARRGSLSADKKKEEGKAARRGSLSGDKKKEEGKATRRGSLSGDKKKEEGKAARRGSLSGDKKKDEGKAKRRGSLSADKKKDDSAHKGKKKDKKPDSFSSKEKKKSKKEKVPPSPKDKKKSKGFTSDWKPPKSPRKGADDSKRSRTSRGKESPKASKLLIVPSKAKKSSLPVKPKSALMIKPKSFVSTTPSKPQSFVMQPKSRTRSLVVVPPKSKTSLVPTKPKSKKIAATDFDDDDSFVMNDFDDDFSAARGFGDFGEDGSVVPLKAVRNAPIRSGKRPDSKKDKKKEKSSAKSGSKGGKSKDKGSKKSGKSKDKSKSEKKKSKKSKK